jgi:hypothetical protein
MWRRRTAALTWAVPGWCCPREEAVNPQPLLFADAQGAGLVPKLKTITGEALERWR